MLTVDFKTSNKNMNANIFRPTNSVTNTFTGITLLKG